MNVIYQFFLLWQNELWIAFHVFQVWVFDTETAGQNSSTLIIITVTDVNDNNPEFENQPLFFTVPEGDYTIPLPLGEVNVIDQDAGLNGQTTVTSENKDIFIVQKVRIYIQYPLAVIFIVVWVVVQNKSI